MEIPLARAFPLVINHRNRALILSNAALGFGKQLKGMKACTNVASEDLQQTQPPGNYDVPTAPIVLSILGMIVWLVFILFYALYWSDGFTLFQNVIVTIVSLAISCLIIGLMWIPWYHTSGQRR